MHLPATITSEQIEERIERRYYMAALASLAGRHDIAERMFMRARRLIVVLRTIEYWRGRRELYFSQAVLATYSAILERN